MSAASLQLATSPTGFLEGPANVPKDAPTSRTPAKATRRSVSSMKGLMPLTLSMSAGSSLPHQMPEKALDQRVDGYFPELLARDLEFSKMIFEARRMTAGSPVTSGSASPFDDCIDRPTTAMSAHRSSCLSPYPSAYARVQTLGAIQERNSMVSFLDQQEDVKSCYAASDSCSAIETDASSVYDAAPPSFMTRHRPSMDLKSASLDPTKRNLLPLSKLSLLLPSESSRGGSSWIENDSDVEDEDASIYGAALHLSPRPPTPPEFEVGSDPRPSGGSMHKLLHRKSHSANAAAALASPSGQHLSNSTTQVWRPSSAQYARHSHTEMQYPDSPESICMPMSQYIPPERAHSRSLHHAPESVPSRRASNRSSMRTVSSSQEAPRLIDEDVRTEYNQFMSVIDPKYAPRLDSVYIRPSPPPSPLPSVQMWLNGSAQLFSLPFQSDELARVVPLPPDVMETLRVTTACFPETMLLSSSLTIETIRTYSRKARNPVADLALLPGPRGPTSMSKQSLWRRVVKRGPPPPGQRTRDVHTPTASLLQSPSVTSLDALKPWASVKNVFGNCSDYICDALYSHIVAYNYVSALVARYPTSLSNGRSSSPAGSQHEDIPKKAASLLGLNDGSTMTSAASIRSARRFSSSHWGREDLMTTNTNSTSTSQDMALRNIQTELLRCIRRLIATARLMAESNTTDEKVVEMEMEDGDVLFMRSLCEIVRVNEEAAAYL